MDELSASFEQLGLLGRTPVDVDMLEVVISMLKSNSMSSLTMEELCLELHKSHIGKLNGKGVGSGVGCPSGETKESPDFRFKTPSKPFVFGGNKCGSSSGEKMMESGGSSQAPTPPIEQKIPAFVFEQASAKEGWQPQLEPPVCSFGVENIDSANNNAGPRKGAKPRRGRTPKKGATPLASASSTNQDFAFRPGAAAGPSELAGNAGGWFWGMGEAAASTAASGPSSSFTKSSSSSVPFSTGSSNNSKSTSSAEDSPAASSTTMDWETDEIELELDANLEMKPFVAGTAATVDPLAMPQQPPPLHTPIFSASTISASSTSSSSSSAAEETEKSTTSAETAASSGAAWSGSFEANFDIGSKTSSAGARIARDRERTKKASPKKKAPASSSSASAVNSAADAPPAWWSESSSTMPEAGAEAGNVGRNSNLPQPPPPPHTSSFSARPEEVRPPPTPDESEASLIQLAERYRVSGRDRYQQEQYEQALDAFTKALNSAPQSWAPRSAVLGNRAASYMMLGRYVEAADDCDNAIRIDNTLIRLHVRRARALLRLGHFAAVDECCARVMETPSMGDAPFPSSSTGKLNFTTDQDVELAKSDARKCLKDLSIARNLTKNLSKAESVLDYEGLLSLTDELKEICPQFKIAHISRANALCKLQRWDEAKIFAEYVTCDVHVSIQRLHAHPLATAPAPSATSLLWSECVGNGSMVRINAPQIVQAILCMGPDLAQCYVSALKNVDASRFCCADVMDRMSAILLEVAKTCTDPRAAAVGSLWAWASVESERIRGMIDNKNRADRLFRNGNFSESLRSYSDALRADPGAMRWNAILHSNRAAAYMSLGLHQEAVSDCHQSIARDPHYARAYLRRARALRALSQYASSIRDYRRYVSSEPQPSDLTEVEAELNDTVESQRKQTRAEQARHEEERFGAGGGWRSQFGGGGAGRGASSSSSRFGSSSTRGGMWDDAEDDDYGGGGGSFRFARGGGGGGSGRSNSGGQRRPPGHGPPPPPPQFGGGGRRNPPPPPPPQPDSDDSGDELDHYGTLGIPRNASESDIKKAFRALALRFHPDKNKDPGAEDKFKTIGCAYAVLSDKQQKMVYDHQTFKSSSRRR